MTSEGPHRPGQEPDEVSPGAGGPAPYGDRPAQPDNGHNAAGPDLGWAPPPPTRPNPSTPAWATQSEQPPAPAWGAAAAPQPSDPAQPAWAAGGTSEPPQQQPGTWPGNDGAPAPAQPAPWAAQQQGWTPAEQSAPAPNWTPNAAEQPEWVQAQPAARGAAQVPPATAAWPAQEDPARAGGWGGAQQPNPPAGDWHGAESQQPEMPQAGGWSGGAQQDDAAGNGGWPASNAPARDDQPVWTPAEQSPPTWGQPAEADRAARPRWGQAAQPGAARGAAQVPAPAANWPSQDDPAHSGGWAAQQQAQPAAWNDGGDARQDQAEQPAAWGGAESRPQQPDWVLAPQDQPAERPEPAVWNPPEQSGLPARASVSVPSNDGAPGWAANQDNAAQANPGVPAVEPWAPGEVWGRAEAEASAQSRGGWEADRGDEAPAYQPGPAPGISPANAVPLPPQEQRVPGASLAAAPPADYAPPQAQFAPIPEQPAYAEREDPDAAGQYEAEPAGWGRAGDAPASGGAMVPAPRTSPESGAGRAVVPASEADSADGAAARATASASVPLASRVMPPTDQAIRPTGTATPQPRVYGRPARPEPENEPEPEASRATREPTAKPHRNGRTTPSARPHRSGRTTPSARPHRSGRTTRSARPVPVGRRVGCRSPLRRPAARTEHVGEAPWRRRRPARCAVLRRHARQQPADERHPAARRCRTSGRTVRRPRVTCLRRRRGERGVGLRWVELRRARVRRVGLRCRAGNRAGAGRKLAAIVSARAAAHVVLGPGGRPVGPRPVRRVQAGRRRAEGGAAHAEGPQRSGAGRGADRGGVDPGGAARPADAARQVGGDDGPSFDPAVGMREAVRSGWRHGGGLRRGGRFHDRLEGGRQGEVHRHDAAARGAAGCDRHPRMQVLYLVRPRSRSTAAKDSAATVAPRRHW